MKLRNTDKRAGTYTDADGVKHNQYIDEDGQHYYIDSNGMHVLTDRIEGEEDFNNFLDEIDNE